MSLVLERGDTVVQLTDPGHCVHLHREFWRTESGLGMVRKHLPRGPTRPPVLLVHGFAQNRYSWHTSRRSMSAWLAAQGWDVWNLELRGHGRSRDEGLHGAECFADYVADVAEVARLLPGPAFWVGHSLGGAVLYASAAEGTVTLGIVGIGALYRFGQHNWAIKLLGTATHALRDAPWIDRLDVRTRMVGHVLSRAYQATDLAGYGFPLSGWWPGSVEPELLHERLVRGFDWTSVTVWREMSRWAATDELPYDEAWRRTDVPLLVLLGDCDSLMPPEDGRAAFDRSGSSDKQLVVLDAYHHDVHWGHLDLILGKSAPVHVWPMVDGWMSERLPGGSKAR